MASVALGSSTRTNVWNELRQTKSLLDAAKTLGIVDLARHPEESRILARLAGTAEEGAIRTAITDALGAGRTIKYVCGIENAKVVNDIHCHIHVDENTTVLEFVPGVSH
jgi:hypothetical protein